ncbi:hypothetical protein K1719_028291 [Acacia pycnantha]|nr:hypothetical protein K1719_028291 [Acacia pycnantha]
MQRSYLLIIVGKYSLNRNLVLVSIFSSFIQEFNAGLFDYLIATDGSHIMEKDEATKENNGYVHRIGRTGRAYNSGSSVSLVSTDEM